MGEQWYFMENGQQQGPIDVVELRRFAATGRIAPATMVWQQGLPQWIPAARLNGLFPSEPATPPPPPVDSAPPPPSSSGGGVPKVNVAVDLHAEAGPVPVKKRRAILIAVIISAGAIAALLILAP